MHEISVGKHTIRINNFQFSALFFFFLSGMGFAACAFLVLIDIIRWSIQ